MVENRRRGDQKSTNFPKKWYFGSFKSPTKIRTKKNGLKRSGAGACWRSGRVARRNVHGRREGKGGKPSLVRTGVNVIQDAGRGAADLIASRIPPGRIDWVVGGRVVFFVLVVFSVFYVFVGLVAVLGCLLVVWLLGCWFEQPNNPKKQPPNNPIIRQPSYQTTQEHNNPPTQQKQFTT